MKGCRPARLVTDDEVLGDCGWGSFFESGGGCLPAMGFLARDFHGPAHSRVRSVSDSGPEIFLLFVGAK